MTRPDTFPRIAKIGDREFEFDARFPPHCLNAMELFERERLDYPCTVQVRSHEDDMFSVFRIDDGPDSTVRVSCLFAPSDCPFGVDEEEQERLYQAALEHDGPSPGIYAGDASVTNPEMLATMAALSCDSRHAHIFQTAVHAAAGGCWCDVCEATEERLRKETAGMDSYEAIQHVLHEIGYTRRGRISSLIHRVRDVGLRNAWVSWWRMRRLVRQFRKMGG